jgi:hypothetical protein
MAEYKAGDKVEYNGNKDCYVQRQYSDNMYEVRIWDGFRHVGDVCISTADFRKV